MRMNFYNKFDGPTLRKSCLQNNVALDRGHYASERRTLVQISYLRHCLTWQSSVCFGMQRMDVQECAVAQSAFIEAYCSSHSLKKHVK